MGFRAFLQALPHGLSITNSVDWKAMAHEADLRDGCLQRFLAGVDAEIAERVRANGCGYCGGVLHGARYRRLEHQPSASEFEASSRISFCCAQCRRRTTPASVRFLGRRRYPAVALVLLSAVQGEMTAKNVAALREGLGSPSR
jgi:hypothetical protein